MRAAKEKLATHLLVCGSDPPSLLEIPSPPSQNLSSAGRPHDISCQCWWCIGGVCVCVIVCACACASRRVCARMFLFATHFTYLSQHLFENHCGDFATVSSTARWLCGMRTCGLLFAWQFYRRRALLYCHVRTDTQSFPPALHSRCKTTAQRSIANVPV
jgi:hypothetical protein